MNEESPAFRRGSVNVLGIVTAAVVVVGGVLAGVAGWRCFVRFSDLEAHVWGLENRVRRLEAPHDVLEEDVHLPESWLR